MQIAKKIKIMFIQNNKKDKQRPVITVVIRLAKTSSKIYLAKGVIG